MARHVLHLYRADIPKTTGRPPGGCHPLPATHKWSSCYAARLSLLQIVRESNLELDACVGMSFQLGAQSCGQDAALEGANTKAPRTPRCCLQPPWRVLLPLIHSSGSWRLWGPHLWPQC